jgi:hypothetical protein
VPLLKIWWNFPSTLELLKVTHTLYVNSIPVCWFADHKTVELFANEFWGTEMDSFPLIRPFTKYGDSDGCKKNANAIIPIRNKNMNPISTKMIKANLATIVFDSRNSEPASTIFPEEKSPTVLFMEVFKLVAALEIPSDALLNVFEIPSVIPLVSGN